MNDHPVHRPTSPPTREHLVGAAVRHSEDRRFVTGRGRYVADVVDPGHCHAVVVRIDTAAALRTPGVLGGIVATGAAATNAVAAALAPLGVIVRELPLSARNLARWMADARR